MGGAGEYCTEPDLICNFEKHVQPEFSSPPFYDRDLHSWKVTVDYPQECPLGWISNGVRRGDHEHSGSWDMGSCPLVLRIASLTQRPGVVAQWYSACQAGIRSGFGLQHRDGQRGGGGE